MFNRDKIQRENTVSQHVLTLIIILFSIQCFIFMRFVLYFASLFYFSDTKMFYFHEIRLYICIASIVSFSLESSIFYIYAFTLMFYFQWSRLLLHDVCSKSNVLF